MSCYEIPTLRFLSFPKTRKLKKINNQWLLINHIVLELCCEQKWRQNNTLRTGEIMEQQTTLLGRANSGIQIAKLIQWLCLNFPLQNNQIGCRGNLLPESQFYRRYFSPKVSFIRSYANFATYFCQESIFKKYLDSAKIIKDQCIPGLVW